MFHRVAGLALYSTSCWCLHNLLLAHYYSACRSSVLSFVLPDSSYCSLVHASLTVLQSSPLIVAAPMLLTHKFGANYFLARHQNHAAETQETCESSL
jgi:hypothetical protein